MKKIIIFLIIILLLTGCFFNNVNNKTEWKNDLSASVLNMSKKAKKAYKAFNNDLNFVALLAYQEIEGIN